MSSCRVLSCGLDPKLLFQRSATLRDAGFDVTEVFTEADAICWAQSDIVDMVLICNTVPRALQRNFVLAIRRKRRLMPILCVVAGDFAVWTEASPALNVKSALLLDALREAQIKYSHRDFNSAA